MHDYAAYGLTIRSELPLPELVEASAWSPAPASRPKGDVDVVIRFARIDRQRPEFADASGWATRDCAFVEYPGTAAFLIRNGHEIDIHVEDPANESLIRLFLLGPAFALLLHQRRFLVLHASAVMIENAAVAFVGDKGMGKSTMAAALHARGHALVADDIVAVDTSGLHPQVFPAFPQLKLFPESAALIDADPQHLPKVHPEFEKRARRAIEGFPSHPLLLRQVFVLADGNCERLEPMPGRPGFMELVRHSYLLAFLNATGSASTHFRQVTSVASRVTVSRLERRRSLEILPRVAQLVEANIERAA